MHQTFAVIKNNMLRSRIIGRVVNTVVIDTEDTLLTLTLIIQPTKTVDIRDIIATKTSQGRNTTRSTIDTGTREAVDTVTMATIGTVMMAATNIIGRVRMSVIQDDLVGDLRHLLIIIIQILYRLILCSRRHSNKIIKPQQSINHRHAEGITIIIDGKSSPVAQQMVTTRTKVFEVTIINLITMCPFLTPTRTNTAPQASIAIAKTAVRASKNQT